MPTLPDNLRQRLDALSKDITASADEAEQQRTVPRSLIDEMRKAGLFRLWLPQELGGEMVDLTTMLLAVEAISRRDGSIGWTFMIGSSGCAFFGLLPDDEGREVFGDPDTIIGGSILPRGLSSAVEGGYSVSGQWPLASGCKHTTWLMANARVVENGSPRLLPNGAAEQRGIFMPSSAAQILDTWNSPGLRGTGSHDFRVEGQFVPQERGFVFGAFTPQRAEHLYQVPLTVLLGYPIAAVALGVARASLDAFEGLASAGRTPSRGAVEIRSRASVQAQVAQAEASLAAARTFFLEVAEEIFDAAGSGSPLSESLMARRMLAANQVADVAREVTSTMFLLGGSSSVQAPNKLERCFRDAHAVAQHIAVAPANWESAGRHFLGLPME